MDTNLSIAATSSCTLTFFYFLTIFFFIFIFLIMILIMARTNIFHGFIKRNNYEVFHIQVIFQVTEVIFKRDGITYLFPIVLTVDNLSILNVLFVIGLHIVVTIDMPLYNGCNLLLYDNNLVDNIIFFYHLYNSR